MKVCTDACLFGGFAAKWMEDNQIHPSHALDIGAGTGLLSLMLAQKLKNTQFSALEPDKGAFSDAKINFALSPFSERLKIIHTDYQNFRTESSSGYPLMICNPPFFANHLKSPEKRLNEARHLEKKEWANWLLFFKNNLAEGGILWLLLSDDLFKETKRLLPEFGFYALIELSFHQKKNKNWRKVLALTNLAPQKTTSIETMVYQESGTYSDTIKQWISDYYLYI